MADVQFTDNTINVEAAISELSVAFLYEAVAELQSQTARNSRVKTGQTKGSWETRVDENYLEGIVGSNLENAIWEEFGTGEYALNDDGRKGGWFYVDEMGVGHFTHGKKPNRALHNAFEEKKSVIIKIAQEKLKGMNDK